VIILFNTPSGQYLDIPDDGIPESQGELMAVNVSIECLDGINVVWIRTSGIYELDAELETVKCAIQTAKNHNCNRLLFDHRKSKVVARVMGAYDRPVKYQEFGLDRSAKLAILLREVDEGISFYETVCNNRGWQAQLFTDYDVAVDWLAK